MLSPKSAFHGAPLAVAMLRRTLALVILAAVLAAGCASNTTTPTPTTTPTGGDTNATGDGLFVKVVSTKGTFVMQLQPELAPLTVAHIQALVKQKFYDGIPFHRYVADFVIQGGDPNCKPSVTAADCGAGGSGTTVPAEFKGKHDYGAVGLARASDPNSGDSQYYIVNNPSGDHGLDGQYCVFGKVVSGMDNVMLLRQGDVMLSVTLQSSA